MNLGSAQKLCCYQEEIPYIITKFLIFLHFRVRDISLLDDNAEEERSRTRGIRKRGSQPPGTETTNSQLIREFDGMTSELCKGKGRT